MSLILSILFITHLVFSLSIFMSYLLLVFDQCWFKFKKFLEGSCGSVVWFWQQMPENPEFGSVQCLVFSQISNKQVWDILRGLIRFKLQFGWMNKLCWVKMSSNFSLYSLKQFEGHYLIGFNPTLVLMWNPLWDHASLKGQ